MSQPGEKIHLIESSLRCFIFGLVGLVPVLGLPFVLFAFAAFLKVIAANSRMWNPARYYLFAGLGLASAGALISLGISVLIAAVITRPM